MTAKREAGEAGDWERKVHVRGGLGETACTEQFFFHSWTTFLLNMCLIRCPFKALPPVRRRERDTHQLKAAVSAVFLL